jgi:hypothetical protein
VIIDTEHMIGGAITAVGSAFSSTDVEVLEAAYVTLQSVTITPNDGRVMLVGMFHVDIAAAPSGSAANFDVQFKRGATVINTTNGLVPVKTVTSSGSNPVNSVSDSHGGNLSFAFVDNSPGTAAVTYTFTARTAAGVDFFADDRYLSALNCKK